MRCIITSLLFLTLSITPTCLLADNWPDGMTNAKEISFAVIYRDDDGRYIAQIPSNNTTELKLTCGTSKPLWLYGSSKPGKCLTVMPERAADTRITELQVTFISTNDNQIVLLSTHDISKEKPPFRNIRDDELVTLINKFPDLLKKEFIGKIKITDFNVTKKFFFVPVEKLNEPTDDPYDPPCTRLKTLVLLQDENGMSKIGFLDNMPKKLISTQVGATPAALTYSFCKTSASLWKIYPKIENEANFSNGVGG